MKIEIFTPQFTAFFLVLGCETRCEDMDWCVACFQGGFGRFGGAHEDVWWSLGLETCENRDIHTSIHTHRPVLRPVLSCFGAFWSFLRLLAPIKGMRWGVGARGCTQGMSGRVLGAPLSDLLGVN